MLGEAFGTMHPSPHLEEGARQQTGLQSPSRYRAILHKSETYSFV